MSAGRYGKCDKCDQRNMLYPEYEYWCKTCYEETVENLEVYKRLVIETERDFEELDHDAVFKGGGDDE